jgi:hypothetical protein
MSDSQREQPLRPFELAHTKPAAKGGVMPPYVQSDADAKAYLDSLCGTRETYRFSDEDLEKVRRWLPDFDLTRPDIDELEALLVGRPFQIQPDGKLRWPVILRLLARHSPPEADASEGGWWTLTEAAEHLQAKLLNTTGEAPLTKEGAKSRVNRAIDKGEIETNGLKGRDRRLKEESAKRFICENCRNTKTKIDKAENAAGRV